MTTTEKEKKTIAKMIRMYCRKHHPGERELCTDCQTLLNYSTNRIDHCSLSGDKPVCSDCVIHCYKPAMREQIRNVMRYSGPRMLWHHPADAIQHLLRRWLSKPINKPRF